MLSALILLAKLCIPWLALALAPVDPSPTAAWVSRCLDRLRQRPAALEHGAPLPTDSASSSDYGTCAARCDGRCFLRGDFDGDGRARELAVANPQELLLYHDVERGRDRRYQAALRLRLPLLGPGLAGGSEVALVSAQRAVRFVDEVIQLRGGKAPLPTLAQGERLALGLIIWRGSADATGQDAEPDDDDARSDETGQLLLAIFDAHAQTYRLEPVLDLGMGSAQP